MVLDAGRIVSPPPRISFFMIDTLRLTMTDVSFSQVEFDKPSELLKKENGRFRSLVDKSSDKDLLYQQANIAAGTSR